MAKNSSYVHMLFFWRSFFLSVVLLPFVSDDLLLVVRIDHDHCWKHREYTKHVITGNGEATNGSQEFVVYGAARLLAGS